MNKSKGAEVSYSIFAHGSGSPAICLEAYNDRSVGIQGLNIQHSVMFNWGGVGLEQGLTYEEKKL